MPRGPRLDAPDTLHHVMVRGIEGRAIFRDDQDREDFLRRLGAVAGATDLAIYAWALLPNHLHLVVRTGATPLVRAMRSLLTSYAGAFNRRHRRRGHLFQNRYKSIVVEAERYLLELVRYIHLNPLRAHVLPDLRALDRYPYTGHAVLLGRRRCPWQDTASVLGRFATRPSRARLAYRAFVGAGIPQGRRPELQGGGLIRSLGGWAAVQALRRGREHYAADERVLGGPAFVEALQRDLAARPAARRPPVPLEAIVERVCAAVHLAPTALQAGSRRPVVCRAREGIAYLAIDVGGYPAPRLVAHLGVRPPSIHKAAQRGRADRARWDRLWNTGKQ
jgi:REP element-mobilizing transposase RayT